MWRGAKLISTVPSSSPSLFHFPYPSLLSFPSPLPPFVPSFHSLLPIFPLNPFHIFPSKIQLWALEKRCNLPQWGPGRSPGRQSILVYFDTSKRSGGNDFVFLRRPKYPYKSRKRSCHEICIFCPNLLSFTNLMLYSIAYRQLLFASCTRHWLSAGSATLISQQSH